MSESITMYYADVCGNPQNCLYPHKGTVTTPEELKRCMAQDHVFIRFKGNYRNNKNFEETVTAVFDCDNDFTEDAAKWISPEDISRLFPGVSCVVSTSRNHMKQKGNKSPRPRFHVIFAIEPITDPTEYTAFMKSVQQMYPFFDDNALDAARFFFGNPDTEVTFFEGNTTLNIFIEEESAERAFAELGETITEGSRNNTMSLFAGSRFARNTVDSLTTVRKLKDKGVEVYFEKENIWTMDSKGELLITIMSSLAQEESRSISENVTWGQRKRFADGKVSMPYKQFLGYRKGSDGLPEIVPEEAETVRTIYRMFIEGLSPNAIARHLTDTAVPTPAGKEKWQRQTVESILKNEKYKGSALLQKKYTVDFMQKKMKAHPSRTDGHRCD